MDEAALREYERWVDQTDPEDDGESVAEDVLRRSADLSRACARILFLVKEVRGLRSLLAALVAKEPVIDTDEEADTGERCAYCSRVHVPPGGGSMGRPVVHEPDCPWLAAKRLLGGEEE